MFNCQWSTLAPGASAGVVCHPNHDPTLRAGVVYLHARAADITSPAFASRNTGSVFDPDARHKIDDGDLFDDLPARGIFT